MSLDYSKLDDLELEFNTDDFPDFADSFITRGTYEGRELTSDEVDELNENSDFVYNLVLDRIF